MAIEWSNSGLDLHVDLGTGQRGRGIADAIRHAVRDGRLAAGTRMPSTRALAADLGIARGTVTRAYAELTAEGYLRSHQGAPTVVAALTRQAGAAPTPPVSSVTEWRWNLMPGRPDLTRFPRAAWLAATRRALTHSVAADLDYGDGAGHPRLRTALADYLGRVRGVVASPERIVVCGGYGQALHLLAGVLRAAGADSIAFEDPSLPQFRDVVHDAGLATVGVPIDEHGIRVDALAGLSGHAAVVVTPAHQFPLGVTLHPHRRTALVELARAMSTVVIEDDYDGEFRFDRQPVGALQAMAPDQVIYAGTASKTLAPGLRLSWLVLPDRLVEPVRAARLGDRHNSVIEQLAMAELLESGDYDQHVRRCRTHYRARRDRLVDVLTELGGELAPAGIAAGLHMVLLLPDQATETEVLMRAAARSLLVEGLRAMWLPSGGEPRPGGIIVGYAAPPDHGFGSALGVLADVLTEVLGGPSVDIR